MREGEVGYRRRPIHDGSRAAGVRQVLWTVLVFNLAVALAKLAYGLRTRSVAMQADGFHSIFDGASNAVGLVGLAAARRPADREHPYGHGKYESFAAAVIGALLIAAAWQVGSQAIHRFLEVHPPPRVDAGSFVVMLATLAVNATVTVYERRRGKALASEILVADAGHTASDIYVSLGVIASLIAVRAGYPLLDPAIALAVAAIIAWTAWRILRGANVTFSDRQRLPVAEVCEVVLRVPGVLGCHSVRTRGTAAEVFVDCHIQVDPEISVAAGHRIAEEVERALPRAFAMVIDVIVHLEPLDEYQAGKTAREGNLIV